MNFYNDNKSLKFYLSHPVMDKIIKLKERDFVYSDNDNLAPVDVEDAIDSYDKVLEIVGDLAANVLEVNAEDVDHEGPQVVNNEIVYAKGTQKNHEAMRDAGLYGMSLPRKYKGLNFPYVPYVMAAEIVSRADAGFANIWGLHAAFCSALQSCGSESHSAVYCQSGECGGSHGANSNSRKCQSGKSCSAFPGIPA